MQQELIIISGSNGFLGSHLLHKLASPNRKILRISSKAHSLDVLEGLSPTPSPQNSTFLLAGWSGVQTRFKNDDELQRESFERFKAQVLEAYRLGIKKFVGFGSQAEKSADVPNLKLTCYASRKLEAKSWLEEFSQEHNDVHHTWLRIFSVYGPGMQDSWLISKVARAVANKDPLVLGSCSQPWSFLHIDDFVSAVNSILNSKNWPNVIDVADPHQQILKELLLEIQDNLGASNLFTFGEDASEYSSQANLEYLSKLGWKPKWQLAEGVRQLVEQYS